MQSVVHHFVANFLLLKKKQAIFNDFAYTRR